MNATNAFSGADKDILRQQEIESQLAGLHSQLSGMRAAAAKRLGEMQAGLPYLLLAMQDPNENVRSTAVIALGNFTKTDQYGEIIDALLSAIDDPSEKVCQAAIRTLGILHAQPARPEIEEFLSDPNPYIMGAAVLSLARLDAQDLVEKFDSLLDHENLYVKTQAVRAVGILHYRQAGPKILNLLQTIRTLRQAIGQKDLSAHLENRPDHLYGLQNHLIHTAGNLKLVEAVPLLVNIAQKDIGLRGQAVEALIEIGADIEPGTIIDLLNDPSIYLRRRVIQLLVQFDYRQALPQLRGLLREDNASIRSTALNALTQMRDLDAVNLITWLSVHDSNPFIRIQAVQSLVLLLDKGAAGQLIALADDPNFQVRREVISRLIEWEVQDITSLSAMACFARDFPEDDLYPEIMSLLEHCEYKEENQPSRESKRINTLLPLDLGFEPGDMVDKLERWQSWLWQTSANPPTHAWHQLNEAISIIIANLKQNNS